MPIILHLGKVAETDLHREYWRSLGRFVHRFALLEQQINYLLRMWSGISREIGQALLSGVRADQGLSLLGRVFETKNRTPDPMLTRAIRQFGVINSARNDIVHMGATQDGDAFLVSNQHRTVASKVRTTRFTAALIDQMTEDLETISAAFYVSQLAALNQKHQGGVDWEEVARSPWQYKPPAQDRRGRKSRAPGQAPRGQQSP